MGKSDKVSRIKKEQIKALRKKYDEFLEDERKRRDRNVYIIEHLEKMRSCVATLQINQKGITLNNNKTAAEIPYVSKSTMLNDDRLIMRQDVISYRENKLDDNSLLKEISKRYILIPKIHSMLSRSTEIENSNDSDWKSKYNILEELKRNEKYEPPEKYVPSRIIQPNDSPNEIVIRNEIKFNKNIDQLNCTSRYQSSENIIETNFTPLPNHEQESLTQSNSNINEENPSSDTVALETKDYSINNDDWIPNDEMGQYQGGENNQKHCKDNVNNEINSLINNDTDYHENAVDQITVNEVQPQEVEADQQEYIVEKEKHNELKSEDYTENKQENVIEETNKIEFEYNEENINNNDIDKSKSYELDLDTNEITITDQSNENYMQINEFETEQKEMFYEEEVNKVADNNQGFGETEPYATDENYTNEQYHYYEESHAQQPQGESYDNVIDEHQETTANYDQNYEQQYGNSYNNQYENHNNYQNENPNLDYQQPEQLNTQYVHIENYVEPAATSDANINIINNQENYVDHENIGEINPPQESVPYEMHDYVEPTIGQIENELDVEDGYIGNEENTVVDNIDPGNIKISSQELNPNMRIDQ